MIGILRHKHPEAQILDTDHSDEYQDAHDDVGIFCFEEDVATISATLGGAAGPSGVDTGTLKHWTLCSGVYLEKLWEEMALWVTVLANSSPDYAVYYVVNSARMLVTVKEPGIRLLACGEIYMRLWGHCCLAAEAKASVCDACGNLQTCAELQSDIKGNAHAVRLIWSESAGWTFDCGTSEQP